MPDDSEEEDDECSYEYVIDSNQKQQMEEEEDSDGNTTNELEFKIFETAKNIKQIDKHINKVKKEMSHIKGDFIWKASEKQFRLPSSSHQSHTPWSIHPSFNKNILKVQSPTNYLQE